MIWVKMKDFPGTTLLKVVSSLSNSNHQSPMKILNPQISNNLRHKIQQLPSSFISTMSIREIFCTIPRCFDNFRADSKQRYQSNLCLGCLMWWLSLSSLATISVLCYGSLGSFIDHRRQFCGIYFPITNSQLGKIKKQSGQTLSWFLRKIFFCGYII